MVGAGLQLAAAGLAVVAMAGCTQGATPAAGGASPGTELVSVDSCTLGGDEHTAVTIYVTTASSDTAYEVDADVRLLNRKGAPPERHRVSFVVEQGASRVYVVPGMEKGAAQYKACKAEVLSAAPL